MTLSRRCSKPSCSRPAVATLTYVYADSTVVVGPLATQAEPHCYDLCQSHADRLNAPRGWDLVRITREPQDLQPSSADLAELADAVRQAAVAMRPTADARPGDLPPGPGRRGHLRVLPRADD